MVTFLLKGCGGRAAPLRAKRIVYRKVLAWTGWWTVERTKGKPKPPSWSPDAHGGTSALPPSTLPLTLQTCESIEGQQGTLLGGLFPAPAML